MRTAIIFDLDGTLADSEPIHERALRAAVETEGMTLTSQQFFELCVGFGDLPALANIARANSRDLTDAQLLGLSATKHHRFAEILGAEGVPACPGAVELVRASAQRVPIAVCSGSRRQTVLAVLEALGLASLPSAIVTLDDVDRGKPHPEPYLQTAQRLGCSPAQCIAIEDTPSGVASAVAAGMRVVAVEHSMAAAELSGAHRVVATIADLHVDDLLSV